jgi:hypothetical protein
MTLPIGARSGPAAIARTTKHEDDWPTEYDDGPDAALSEWADEANDDLAG